MLRSLSQGLQLIASRSELRSVLFWNWCWSWVSVPVLYGTCDLSSGTAWKASPVKLILHPQSRCRNSYWLVGCYKQQLKVEMFSFILNNLKCSVQTFSSYENNMNSLLKIWKTQKVTRKKVKVIWHTMNVRLPWLTLPFLNYVMVSCSKSGPDRPKFKFHFRKLLVE